MKKINRFLLDNDILIKDNPAISPDMVLDADAAISTIAQNQGFLGALSDSDADVVLPLLQGITLYPQSKLRAGKVIFYLVEIDKTGDQILITTSTEKLPFEELRELDGIQAIPMTWENIIHLKNFVMKHDPSTTLFPVAEAPLDHYSLGIGARMTTMHWPAVAWSMKELGISLTANQNSVPRELVYDVDAMLEDRLSEIPFIFIGGTVPEGHQGQSVQGMSHASILTYLKTGFHQNNIAYGFNADHQPVGGRFDLIEDELVEGSLFASYITFDLSPELMETELIEDSDKLNETFAKLVDKSLEGKVREGLSAVGLKMDDFKFKQLLAYIKPAMDKLIIRDKKYSDLRKAKFTSERGQRYFRELSIDELPGLTTVETLAACLSMAEAMGIKFNFVAPNIGFQKNFPYADNDKLAGVIRELYDVSKKFSVAMGFHSGSGKSAENYRLCGQQTDGNLEVKTSGRYTYEFGVALKKSSNSEDQKLWKDWYAFTLDMAVEGAFADLPDQKKAAREFIDTTLKQAEVKVDGLYENADSLRKALESLDDSPDHMFWFEYNFLYVLKGKKLGDHSKAGYDQRARFYGISDEGKLGFAKGIAAYIIFLAETTGSITAEKSKSATQKLEAYSDYKSLISDIC